MQGTIQECVINAMERYQNKIAIEYGSKEESYSELNRNSENIANMLLKRKQKDNLVIGLLMNNKIHLIEGILGILRAGCIFVPLDVNHQEQRLRSMADYVDMDCVLYEDETEERFQKIFEGRTEIGLNIDSEELPIKQELSVVYHVDDPIYIFFTSGTTGVPKAILGKNKSLVHFVDWELNYLKLEKDLRVSQVTSAGFDAILRDIFITLCGGGTICIPQNRESILDEKRLGEWIEKSRINVLHCTPTLFRLVENERKAARRYEDLEYVMLAGEKINPSQLKGWYETQEKVKLVNLYGPSETTMVKTFYEIQKSDLGKKKIPIGKAMEGADIYLLDEQKQLCEQGQEGEIWIATDYMSHGYYHNEELTQEKFQMIQIGDNEPKLMYRTGDYGVQLKDSNYEYIGRKDRQIKVRGNRVELGEIEEVLSTYPGIEECIAYLEEDKTEEEVKYCKQCGITSKYDGVHIGADGICNVCREYSQYTQIIQNYFRPMHELKEKLISSKRKGKYDCILLYSGGKDSTYVLYQLVEMGVHVLAFVFDNGYISDTALENINRVVTECNVDCVIQKQENMDKVFAEGLKEECSVCLGCFRVLNTLSTQYAYEHGIPYIVNGLSRGQIFDVRLYDILHSGKQITVDALEEGIKEQRILYHAKKDYVSETLGDCMMIESDVLEQVELIDFYRYTDVTKDEIMNFLKSKSTFWSQPKDTGACSSNCLVNDVGIYVQRKKKGYDNYTFPNSWEVRLGHITLEESQKELEQNVNQEKVKSIMAQIGYEDFDEEETSKNLVSYYVSKEPIDEKKLYEYLSSKLPAYEVPSGIMQIDRIPITQNGKIDYDALPEVIIRKKAVAFRDDVELKVAKIWSELLDKSEFTRDDNFLTIGGHSLKIMTMVSKIYEAFEVELPLEVIFNNPVISKIAEYIRNSQSVQVEQITDIGKKEFYPLSSPQRRLFFIEEYDNVKTACHITNKYEIRGEVDEKKLEEALQKLIERHVTLRTHFKIINDEVVQVVEDKVDFKLEVYTNDNEEEVMNSCIKPFDIWKAPLFRAVLVKKEGGNNTFILDFHHLISDGKSVRIALRDVLAFYRKEPLPELPIRYVDYVEWYNKRYEENKDELEDYWFNVFANYQPGTRMAKDFIADDNRKYQGGNIVYELPESLVNDINQLATQSSTTIFILMFASFNILYSKLTAEEDIMIGSPIEGRKNEATKELIGMFVNMIAIRSFPEGTKMVSQYLEEMKQIIIGAFDHDEFPIESLIGKFVQDGIDVNEENFFDALFSMQYIDSLTEEGTGVLFNYQEENNLVEYENLRVVIYNYENRIFVSFVFSRDLYKESTVQNMLNDYVKVLEYVAKTPDMKIQDITIREEHLSEELEGTQDFDVTFQF